MDFIKNNKLTCILGMLCLIMSFVSAFSNNKTDLKNTVSSQKESFQVADNQIVKDLDSSSKNTSLKNLKEDSNINSNLLDNLNINLVRNDDDELNGILQSESKRLMNESNEELLARLQFNESEDELGASMEDTAKDLQANYTPKNYIDYKISQGDTFTQIFLKQGDTTKASLKAYEALRKVNKSYTSLRLGEIIKIYKKDGKIDKIEKKLPLGKEVTLTLNDDGSFTAKVYEPKIIEKDKVVTGKISSCFSVEAKKLGIPNDVIDQFVDLFAGKVSFRSSLRRGDVFSIKYSEKRTDDGMFLSAGSIKAASIINQGKFLSLVGYKGKSGKMSYFNEKGETAGNYMLRYPVKFSRISSVFSDGRLHPILKTKRPHNGVDFAAPTGTPVRSVADGRVVFAGWNGGAGKMIKIQHSSKYKTAYMHLSKIGSNIKVGKYVSRGDYIGDVGSTGLSTGPHLHYSFYINDRYVDPLKIDLPSLPIGGDTIPNAYLKNAIAELRGNTEKMMASRDNDEPQV